MMNNIEKNTTGEKSLRHKKVSIFVKFMRWIEKGRENEIQCVS